MKYISKLEYSVAAPTDTNFLDEGNRAVKGTMDLLRFFQSPTVTITISRGHSPSYPSQNKIVSVVKNLFKSDGDQVKKLRVSGVDGDDQSEAINFLLDQIQETTQVKYDDKRRTMPYIPRRNAMREALAKWAEDL